jgi:N6-adenosine-specific RNA methylase IME4
MSAEIIIADARQLPWHPLASLFPLLVGAEFEELVADIRAHKVREPAWIYQGKVLDGRNRTRAAAAAGVPCPARIYDGDDPVGFVVSLNLRRRHLNESQRAMVAAKVAKLPRGSNQHAQICAPSQNDAAEMLNVSRRSVQYAREIVEHGAPELQQAVDRGEVAVSNAADIASLPLDQQRAIIAQVDSKLVLKAAKAIRSEKWDARRAERIAKIAAINNASSPLPQDRSYPVILADPAWRFEVYDRETGLDVTADAHYPTMPIEDICALPVGGLAARDAVLFMWTTAPCLPQAFEVLSAWSFDYVTHLVWVKDRSGLGYWVRNQHELLIISRRGNMPAASPRNRPRSIINAPRRAHSQKPDEAYELIERMYPELPKIELFARSRRPGWDAWGNELPPPARDQAPPPPSCEMPEIPDFLRRAAPSPSDETTPPPDDPFHIPEFMRRASS